MIIRNAVIITEEHSPVQMRLDELPNFTGNVVLCRSRLSPAALAHMASVAFASREIDATAPDFSGATVQPELIR